MANSENQAGVPRGAHDLPEEQTPAEQTPAGQTPTAAAPETESAPPARPVTTTAERQRRDRELRLLPLAAAILFGVAAMLYAASVQGERTRIWQELNGTQDQINSLQAENQQLKLQSGGLDSSALDFLAGGTAHDAVDPGVKEVKVRLFSQPGTGVGYGVIAHLPALPAGKIYALWLSQANIPLLAGTFTPDTAGGALVKMLTPGSGAQFSSVLISVEANRNSSTPSGDLVFQGVIQ